MTSKIRLLAFFAGLSSGLCSSMSLQDASTSQGDQIKSELSGTSGQIAGHVYRSDTHEPVGKAVVVLNPQDAAPGARRRVTRTNLNGAFAISNVAPAAYAFEVDRTGFVVNYRERKLLHAQEELSVDFVLVPGAVVFGFIDDEDGEAVRLVCTSTDADLSTWRKTAAFGQGSGNNR